MPEDKLSLAQRYDESQGRSYGEEIVELEKTKSALEQELQSRGRAERRLKLLSDALENSFNGFDIVDAKGAFIYANRAYLEMWGYDSLGEIYGTSPARHCVDADVPSRIISKLVETGEAEIEFLARRKDGSEFDVVMYARRAFDEEGNEIFIRTSADISQRKQAESNLRRALREIRKLKDQVQAENVYLREQIRAANLDGNIIGGSNAMKSVLLQIRQVAETDSTVLILGETGTGKELVTRAIHDSSNRRGQPLIMINCAAIPEELIESELFGREKGAYTGAYTKRMGRFEAANGGTIVLDEIGELSIGMQSKLLRVLQERQIERLGSTTAIDIDVRVIAATNRDLAEDVRNGNFREDLFYRLNIFPITVPPLRDRSEDIPTLVWNFVEEFSEKMGKDFESISKASLESLVRYPWPGNVRELRNVIERAAILCKGKKLTVELPGRGRSASSHLPRRALDDVQRDHITSILESTDWRVRGKNGAAEILEMQPSTLESRMKKLGIRRPR